MKPSAYLVYESTQSPAISDFTFSLHIFGTHLASPITSPRIDLTQMKTNIKACIMLFSCLPLHLSTNYQYVNCFLYKTVFKVTSSLGFFIQIEVTTNHVLLYNFSVKLFSVLCVPSGIIVINVGTDKHNIPSYLIFHSKRAKEICVSSRQLPVSGKTAQMNRNNLA